jgi:hypothetical protein
MKRSHFRSLIDSKAAQPGPDSLAASLVITRSPER